MCDSEKISPFLYVATAHIVLFALIGRSVRYLLCQSLNLLCLRLRGLLKPLDLVCHITRLFYKQT